MSKGEGEVSTEGVGSGVVVPEARWQCGTGTEESAKKRRMWE
jgi:hypothetical protein